MNDFCDMVGSNVWLEIDISVDFCTPHFLRFKSMDDYFAFHGYGRVSSIQCFSYMTDIAIPLIVTLSMMTIRATCIPQPRANQSPTRQLLNIFPSCYTDSRLLQLIAHEPFSSIPIIHPPHSSSALRSKA